MIKDIAFPVVSPVNHEAKTNPRYTLAVEITMLEQVTGVEALSLGWTAVSCSPRASGLASGKEKASWCCQQRSEPPTLLLGPEMAKASGLRSLLIETL